MFRVVIILRLLKSYSETYSCECSASNAKLGLYTQVIRDVIADNYDASSERPKCLNYLIRTQRIMKTYMMTNYFQKAI